MPCNYSQSHLPNNDRSCPRGTTANILITSQILFKSPLSNSPETGFLPDQTPLGRLIATYQLERGGFTFGSGRPAATATATALGLEPDTSPSLRSKSFGRRTTVPSSFSSHFSLLTSPCLPRPVKQISGSSSIDYSTNPLFITQQKYQHNIVSSPFCCWALYVPIFHCNK